MRLLILIMLLAPGLHALDTKDVDGDTLQDVRRALLKDEVRGHFGLRVGDFESLDQALRVKFDGAHLLCMRLGDKSAAVIIRAAPDAARTTDPIRSELRELGISLEPFGDDDPTPGFTRRPTPR